MQLIRRHFVTIDSTNTWAKQNVHLLPRDSMTVVTADAQTAGRGTFNRQWVSPYKQNIYASFCFFLEKLQPDIGNIPQLLALSIVRVLKIFQINARLKWPNDVLVSGKKIAGILTETVDYNGEVCVVVGVGLNVNMPLEILGQIGNPATSLLVESGKEYDVESVLSLLGKEFVSGLDLFFANGFSPFVHAYREHFFVSPAQMLHCRDGKIRCEGFFEGIDDRGALRLRLVDGTIKTLVAGELNA